MKDRIERFLADLDRILVGRAFGQVLNVYHIGRSALVWEYDYTATTQDFDILRPKGGAELLHFALQQFGKGTAKATEHGLYLEVVEDAFPPMPAGYERRARPVQGAWEVLRIFRLDPHDLAASKLRRFAAKDRADIRLLCDLGHIEPERLETLLEKAYLWSMEKDGDEYRDNAFESLRIVQRYLRGEISEF